MRSLDTTGFVAQRLMPCVVAALVSALVSASAPAFATRGLEPGVAAADADRGAARLLAQRKAKKRTKDVTPPVIEHQPVTRHDGVGPIVVEAKITDAQGKVFEPALLVRAKGSDVFIRVPLTATTDKPAHFSAEVPQELLSGDVEYILEAFDEDGNGPARAGEEAAPMLIARDVPAQETDSTTTTTTVTPNVTPKPPEDEGVSPALIATGVVVGTIVILGAAAGTGFAIYALREPAPQTVRVNVSGPAPVGAAP